MKAVHQRRDPEEVEALIRDLSRLRQELADMEAGSFALVQGVHASQLKSARNLLHYLALRRADRRPLQTRLAALGLSSLGRSEAHVMATLDSVLSILFDLARKPWPAMWEPGPVGFEEGRELLKMRTKALLGPKESGRWVRIMVTMPSEAATNPALVKQLLVAGMNCMRINCAHDRPLDWRRMVRHLRSAEKETGLRCRVVFDLGGPKLRTGPLADGPRALKWRPVRDSLGKVVAPARIWLTPANRPETPPDVADAVLPLPLDWLSKTQSGDVVRFVDARESARELKVVSVHGDSRFAECRQTAYVQTGTEFSLDHHVHGKHGKRKARLGLIPPIEAPIVLHPGDTLQIFRELITGQDAVRTEDGTVTHPARIGMTSPEAMQDLKVGERVWLDDGKIGGIITLIDKEHLELRITHARPRGEKLRADKGINFPDSTLRLPSLSSEDLANLPEVVRRADLVGYSFVQTPEDVEELHRQLKRVHGSDLGIILKIETKQAFDQLPLLLLAAMRHVSVGVMIARGDLAVQCGYERMAELQEEILWVCEAAHVPVIWATQVLEKLSREGQPTRAEVTDAAMGGRAECVMLNKGPGMVAAVESLDNILTRMQDHQNKKQSMMRSLEVARNFKSPTTEVKPLKPQRAKAG